MIRTALLIGIGCVQMTCGERTPTEAATSAKATHPLTPVESLHFDLAGYEALLAALQETIQKNPPQFPEELAHTVDNYVLENFDAWSKFHESLRSLPLDDRKQVLAHLQKSDAFKQTLLLVQAISSESPDFALFMADWVAIRLLQPGSEPLPAGFDRPLVSSSDEADHDDDDDDDTD